jgi:nitrogen fixation/metabolism regulation signal transduction histidine kinase
MLSNKLYINIVIRVLLIALLSILLGFFVFRMSSVRLSILCSLAIIIVTVNLILFLNKTNRNIRFFFDSVKNDDSNLSFSLDNKSGNLMELHRSMNNVNLQIQNLKIENRQQEQFFRKILELLGTAIITYDSKGFIHHANSAAKRLLSVETLTHISQIERLDRKLYTVVKNIEEDEKQLVPFSTKHGEINLLLKSTSSGSDMEKLTILSVQDIKTELDEKELDAWMKLIRVLMHEIMNSITPITSLSESLQKIYRKEAHTVTPGEISSSNIDITLRGLEAIREQGKGLMHFVESFRRLTSIPKPEMRQFSIMQLFNRVEVLIEPLEKSPGISVEFNRQLPDIKIYADENLVSQVLINLIKNAVEANENNPKASIRISAGISDDKSPEICVSDNGPGIREDNIENIFVPFFTTREKGSGIGLSLSRQIMGLHGGSLTVRSVPGRETIFCMKFRSRQ